jgi:CubicO group peptidase (beta-lactamase class C family)
MLLLCLPCVRERARAQAAAPPTRAQKQRPGAEELRARLDDYLMRAAAFGFSGAILVARDGEVVLRKGYGWADQSRRVPVAPDTVFDIVSITKVFTTTAIMQLESQGRLNTDDPVGKYFPDAPADKSGVMLRQLITHTAGVGGLDDYPQADAATREKLRTRDEFVKTVLALPLQSKPGEQYSYSNESFSILAAVVEKVSGEPYDVYLREHVFKPAGMLHTGYRPARFDKRKVAHGYFDEVDYGLPWEAQWAPEGPRWDMIGNGGILSNIDDMYRWAQALQGETVLPARAKEKMFTVVFDPKRDFKQAYGWRVLATKHGSKVLQHSGDADPFGWNADFRIYPEDHAVLVLLTNRRIGGSSIRRPLVAGVESLLFGDDQPPKLPTFTLPKGSTLKKFEGMYALDSGAVFHVAAEDAAIDDRHVGKRLIISGEGQQALNLLNSVNRNGPGADLRREMNAKTTAFVEALRKEDAGELKAVLPPQAQPEDVIARWRSFASHEGGLRAYELLGTARRINGGVQTYVRLIFEKSSGLYRVAWIERNLAAVSNDRLQPAATRYLRKSPIPFPITLPLMPQTTTDFVSYDLFTAATLRVTFEINPRGAVSALVFHTNDGVVTARKR